MRSAAWQICQHLVEAALSGADDGDLTGVLGRALGAAGVDVCEIEVACDAVDPEQVNRYLHWRSGHDRTGGSILAEPLFQSMLTESVSVRRLGNDELARMTREGATDAIAFVHHLAPDVTLGFFDDVMTLFVTARGGGFTDAEVALLHGVVPLFALALSARLNAAAARVLLQTYLGRDASTAMLSGRVGLGEVADIRAVVLYCDLVGFTGLTETLDARTLIDHLNLFFETMTQPIAAAGGQVAGHVGDAIVMFFPIPDAASEASLCAIAVRAAMAGLDAVRGLTGSGRADLAVPLQARIGIDRGDVVHGNIGSPGRFSFTIIGTPVNRAARLQALAKQLDAIMLMPADLAEAASVPCRSFGHQALRGFEHPVAIVGLSNPNMMPLGPAGAGDHAGTK